MLYFKEEQRFDQWWVRGVLIFTNLTIIIMFTNALYTQLILGEPWGDKPMSDMKLIGLSLVSTAILAGVNWLIFSSKLETKIDKQYIRYRYFPIIPKWKKLSRDDLLKAWVRKYSPIFEYRGWGYRVSLGGKNKALNTRGNMGLQLVLKNNKRLLLGTQKPEELKRVISEFMEPLQPETYG